MSIRISCLTPYLIRNAQNTVRAMNIPTRGTKVPAGPVWLHEIKHDGYRLLVHRESKRVRLLTRNGHD